MTTADYALGAWNERILSEFPTDLSRLWIAADPDDVLLEEGILAALQERGFEVLPFDDPVAFRADYESRYRSAWDRGDEGPQPSLLLHWRAADTDELPWDWLRQARLARLSLAELFPRLSYGVVRQLDPMQRASLFAAQDQHAAQVMGDAATRDFILTHLYSLGPYFIHTPVDLWRELLRLHHRQTPLPDMLADQVVAVLAARPVFAGLPLRRLFTSPGFLLRTVQEAWSGALRDLGISGSRIAEPPGEHTASAIRIPFEHPDIRMLVDNLFQDGSLHPLRVEHLPEEPPDWARVGLIRDPMALGTLVREGLQALLAGVPGPPASHRDWGLFARRLGELQVRCRQLPDGQGGRLQSLLAEVQTAADQALAVWIGVHYWQLPSLPVAGGPAMVHQIPRYLARLLDAGAQRLALVVFDGMAIDDWVEIRESLATRAPRFSAEEGACFAWLPTITEVSRQALFSGLKPREFAGSIETTAREPAHWLRFWQDQGLHTGEVLYRKGLRRLPDLDVLESELARPALRVAGLVVNTVDDMAHGTVLGKEGLASQIRTWCDSSFVEGLFDLLLEQGFQVWLTADHGNVAADGVGRPRQGLAVEAAGERVRVYRSEALREAAVRQYPGHVVMPTPALPEDYLPLFATGRTAFVNQGVSLLAHGGLAVEELIVPFVKVSRLP